MFSTSKVRMILAALLLVAMFGVTAAPRVHANSQSNSITFTVNGGNVTAVAACLNLATHAGVGVQANSCANYAFARGNTIIIKGVSIVGVQTNQASMGDPKQKNSLSFTVNGGNVTAVAACVNAAAHAGVGAQVNECINTAIAIGNIIVLINVNVTGIQMNS
jgi:hypothetical protein